MQKMVALVGTTVVMKAVSEDSYKVTATSSVLRNLCTLPNTLANAPKVPAIALYMYSNGQVFGNLQIPIGSFHNEIE